MVSEAGRALHYSTRHKNFYRLAGDKNTQDKDIVKAKKLAKELQND